MHGTLDGSSFSCSALDAKVPLIFLNVSGELHLSINSLSNTAALDASTARGLETSLIIMFSHSRRHPSS